MVVTLDDLKSINAPTNSESSKHGLTKRNFSSESRASSSKISLKNLSDSEAHFKAMQIVNRLKEISSAFVIPYSQTSARNAFSALYAKSSTHKTGTSRTYMSEEAVAKRCQEYIQGLCVLTRNPEAKFYMVMSTGTFIQTLFVTFNKYQKVLQGLCDLVWSLAYHDKNLQNVFSESGITELIIQCAKCYKKDIPLLKSAFGALSSLCRHPTNQTIARKEKCIQMLIDVIGCNGHSDQILSQYALDAVASLSHGNSENAEVLFKLKCIPSVVEIMKKNLHCGNVVRSAGILLVVLREKPGGTDEIIAAGGIPVLLKACKVHIEVQELVHILCALLGQLVRENSTISKLIKDQNHMITIFEIMGSFPRHWLIVEACSLIIANADSEAQSPSENSQANSGDSYDSEYWNQIASTGVSWNGFLNVLKEHEDRISLLVTVIKALSTSCQGQDTIRKFSDLGIPKLLYTSLSRFYLKVNTNTKEDTLQHKVDSQYLPAIMDLFKTPSFKIHSLVSELLVLSQVNGIDSKHKTTFYGVWDDFFSNLTIPNLRMSIKAWMEVKEITEDESDHAALAVTKLLSRPLLRDRIVNAINSENETCEDTNTTQRKTIFLFLRQVFSHLSMILLRTKSHEESRVISLDSRSKKNPKSFWVPCLSEALSLLRHLKSCLGKKEHDVSQTQNRFQGRKNMNDGVIPLAGVLLRFIACSLHKNRQLVLRAMASNGGVTLILQIQKYCKTMISGRKYNHNSTQCFNNQMAQTSFGIDTRILAMLETIVKILKLIGSGNDCPPLLEPPSLDSIIDAYVTTLQTKQSVGKVIETLSRPNDTKFGPNANSNDNGSNADMPTKVKESDKGFGNLSVNRNNLTTKMKNEQENNDAFSDTSSEGTQSSNVEEDFGSEETNSRIEIDVNDSNNALIKASEEDKPIIQRVYEGKCFSAPIDGTSRQNLKEGKAILNKIAEIKAGDVANPISKSHSLSRYTNKFLHRKNDAFPGFVVQTPFTVDDLPTLTEPYTPESERIDNATAIAMTMSLSLKSYNYSTKRLVYDWRLASGEGKNKARTTIPPTLPYTLENNIPLQFSSPESSPMLDQDTHLYKVPIVAGGERKHILNFESRFESGNLLQATQTGLCEYDLVLRSDIHTQAHHQWFFFGVTNTHPPGESGHIHYTFNIVNLTKPTSMFSHGMKPIHYSFHRARTKNIGWRRNGDRIAYYANAYQLPSKKLSSTSPGHYYTLSFRMTFTTPGDKHLIAMSFPYTYTNLQRFLERQCLVPHVSDFVRRDLLCKTLGGLKCDLLTISDFTAPQHEIDKREVVVFTGRVHPGEVNASYMMEGTIQFLLGSSPIARMLRDIYVFKVIPMLNPDGVYHGNTRCSLAGLDLNRAWGNPKPDLHPTVWHTKQLIRHVVNTRKVALFVDFHGHSRKKNIFMYGVDSKRTTKANANPVTPSGKIREFPRLISESPHSSHIFSYPDCSFHVQKGHETAARVVVAREFGIKASYTIETSFCGGGPGTNNDTLQESHYSKDNLREVGTGLCDSLLLMNYPDIHNVVTSSFQQSLGVADVTDSTFQKLKSSILDKFQLFESPDKVDMSSTSISQNRRYFRSKVSTPSMNPFTNNICNPSNSSEKRKTIARLAASPSTKPTGASDRVMAKSKSRGGKKKSKKIKQKPSVSGNRTIAPYLESETPQRTTSTSSTEFSSNSNSRRRHLRSQRHSRNNKSSSEKNTPGRPYTSSNWEIKSSNGKGLLWTESSNRGAKARGKSIETKHFEPIVEFAALTSSTESNRSKKATKRSKKGKRKKSKKSSDSLKFAMDKPMEPTLDVASVPKITRTSSSPGNTVSGLTLQDSSSLPIIDYNISRGIKMMSR